MTPQEKITKKSLLSLGFKPIGNKTNFEKRTFTYKGFAIYREPNTRKYYYLPTQCSMKIVKYVWELKIVLPMYVGIN